jgi:adenylate cyclase
VLFSYVATHLANHALGLVSLGAMEAGLGWFLWFWRNPLVNLVLYAALLTHVGLALRSLYRRRHLRMPAWEATQLGLGLLIPPLLIQHVVGTRVAVLLFDVVDSYARTLLGFWYLRPEVGLRQTILLLIAWTHGCIGLHYWLRIRPWYARVALPLFAGAVLLPVLALLGFAQGGRAVAALAQEPGWIAALGRAMNAPDPGEAAVLDEVRWTLWGAYGAAIALVLLGRAVRHARPGARVRVSYPGDRVVPVVAGTSVLEASRLAGIAHASVCGGRGRCSTCRVRIAAGLEVLPPPSAAERRVLQRVGAPPNVRLACQLRPPADVAVVPLLPVTGSPADAGPRTDHLTGREQQLAVLFADLRGFTRLAENRFPYDVVFFLNRYFEAVGRAVDESGGVVNQFTGDGVMALFGVDGGVEDGAQRALLAAAEMTRRVGELSRALREELPAPLRMGIGVHVGPAVVGRMGYAETMYLTAVGDTVHVAARLQELTKEYRCPLVISQEVADRAGVDAAAWRREEIVLRGRGTPQAIRVIDDAERLADAVRRIRTGPEAQERHA